MLFKTFFLSFILTLSSAYAADIYIKLGTTQQASQLSTINQKVNALGYKSFVKTKEQKHTVYSGPFANTNDAAKALIRTKRVFPSATLVRLQALSISDMENREDNVEQTSNEPRTNNTNTNGQSERSCFVTLSLGYHNAQANYSGDTTIDKSMPAATGINYTIEGGVTFYKDIWVSLGYGMLSTGDVSLENAFATLNYDLYDLDSFTLYSGLLLGWSKLSWDNTPLTNSTTLSDSSSMIAGLQVGMKYALPFEGFSLLGTVQWLMMDHSIQLDDAGKLGTIEHTSLQNAQLGLQYKF